MSPRDAGRYTDADTMANLVEEALSTQTCQGDATGYGDEAIHAVATDPWPPRAVSPARIALSHNAHPRPYNDPSNYLG